MGRNMHTSNTSKRKHEQINSISCMSTGLCQIFDTSKSTKKQNQDNICEINEDCSPKTVRQPDLVCCCETKAHLGKTKKEKPKETFEYH